MIKHLTAVLVSLAITTCTWAQDTTAEAAADTFYDMSEAHRDHFRWIDLSDMRAIRASIQSALAQTQSCAGGDCPDFDCPAANGSLSSAGELYMRLSAMKNALDHMHALELAHLRNLHEEANLTEAEAQYQNDVLFWQGAVIGLSASFIQTVFVFGDLDAMSDPTHGALAMLSATDEFLRDTEALYEDLAAIRTRALPRFRERTDPLEDGISFIYDMKSTSENFANGIRDLRGGNLSTAQANAITMFARAVRAWGLEQLSQRQAEVAALNDDAFRERQEANEFAERLRGLGLQRELAALTVTDAEALLNGLSGCIQANCAVSPSPLPPAPQTLLPPDGQSGNDLPRIDHAELERNTASILAIGLRLQPNWIRPYCEVSEETTDTDDSAFGETPQMDLGQIRDDCRVIENAGICSIVTEDRREQCAAGAALAVAACAEMPVIGARFAQAEPLSPAFNAALSDMCRASCAMLYGTDFHLDQQRLVALDQIEELEQQHLANGGPVISDNRGNARQAQIQDLEDQLRQLRTATGTEFVETYYDPATNTYRDGAQEAGGLFLVASRPGRMNATENQLAEELRARIQTLRAEEDEQAWRPRSVWGDQATQFWQTYGPHQFLMCGGETISNRYQECLAGCSSAGTAQYEACSVRAPDLDVNLGPFLYPPEDPRSSSIPSFNAQDALRQARQQ